MKPLSLCLILSLSLCGSALSAQKGTMALIESEINKMLDDAEAFPEGSKQHEQLAQLDTKISEIFAHEGQAHEKVQVPKHEGGMGQRNSMLRGSPNNQRRSTGNSYQDVMNRHRELMADHAQITQLHRELTQHLNQVQDQLAEVNKYRQAIHNGDENEEGGQTNRQKYEEALSKYQEDFQAYQANQKNFLEAKNKYQEAQTAYRAMLDRYNRR